MKKEMNQEEHVTRLLGELSAGRFSLPDALRSAYNAGRDSPPARPPGVDSWHFRRNVETRVEQLEVVFASGVKIVVPFPFPPSVATPGQW